jgi:hypothetical protein
MHWRVGAQGRLRRFLGLHLLRINASTATSKGFTGFADAEAWARTGALTPSIHRAAGSWFGRLLVATSWFEEASPPSGTPLRASQGSEHANPLTIMAGPDSIFRPANTARLVCASYSCLSYAVFAKILCYCERRASALHPPLAEGLGAQKHGGSIHGEG